MIKIMKFTFIQHVMTKSYRISTVVTAFLLMAACILGFVIAGNFMADETVSRIDRVYVCDSSVLAGSDYSFLHKSENELFENVEFVKAQSTIPEEAAAEAAEYSDRACVLEVKNRENGGFSLRVIMPENFACGKKEAKSLASFAGSNLKYVIYESADLTEQQKDELKMDTVTETSVAGEEGGDFLDEIAKNIFPLCLGVLLYVMLCLYGQGVARCMIIEKDSKMMETLLVMTKPYNLMFGKLLGMYLAALLQLFVWIAAAAAGIITGSSLSETSGRKFTEFFGMLVSRGGFTPVSVAAGIISLMAGFLLYISLAGFAGSFASKTEEVNSSFGIYTLVVVACWMFSYMNQLDGNDHMLGIMRYIPFTAPFTVPADVIVGNTGAGTAAVSTLIVIAAVSAVIFMAAKVYKALVLYRGEPIKLKNLLSIIRKG